MSVRVYPLFDLLRRIKCSSSPEKGELKCSHGKHIHTILSFAASSNLLLSFMLFVFLFLPGCSPSRIIQYSGDLQSTHDNNVIILVGDTQRTSFWEFFREQREEERQKIFRSIADENPGALLILGDLVFQGDSPSQWDAFHQYAKQIRFKRIPIFPVLGNHDYFGNDHIALGLFFNQFPHLRNKQWYSFQKSGVGFILLNSNFDKLDDVQIKAQDDWFRRELIGFERNSEISSIVVSCHHPPHTHSTIVDGDVQVREKFLEPFLSTRKGAFFFSGHSHSYEHFERDGKHIIVSGGGGGPRHPLNLNKQGEWIDRFADPKEHVDGHNGYVIRFFHYCRLTVAASYLQLDVKGFYESTDSLRVLDTITFDLSKSH